ncbi:hypothetical protein [Bradyrhizobium zhanjiangense]|uniref:hypothetical protein n=1 Tax=Bradyrhizobium zhanjiangense TaxID=1325107 RepID=UPI001008BAE8|nr:hypothetical protein [Bradyrhizobium zhanjiangense]
MDFASAHVGSSQVAVEIDAVVLTRDDMRLHLDVVPARRVRDLDTEGLVQIAMRELGLQQLAVTPEDLRAETRRSNASLVWSYKDRPVAVPLRLRVLKVLADDGSMQLGALLQTIRSGQVPSPAVMALACANALEIDLTSGPLGLTTQVRSRT